MKFFPGIVMLSILFVSCAPSPKQIQPPIPETQLAVHTLVPTAQPTDTPKTIFTATILPTATIRTTATIQPTATPAPGATPVNTVVPTETQTQSNLNNCLPDNAKVENGKVVKITDGNTIDVNMNGSVFTIRYIGIDTPETLDPNSPLQVYGPAAAQRNLELVNGKDVILVKDTSETDRNDRLLRYVFVGDVFVNEIMVKEGYAFAKQYPPDTACSQVFSAAQGQAQAALMGLWQATPTTNALIATDISPTVSGGCPEGCTEQKPGCDIKGNINSNEEKIYHVPGSSSYSRTKIDPSNGERWFCTQGEAVSNGWRAPRN